VNRRSVYAATLGCDKNLVDSEALLGRFVARGLHVTDDPDQADVWVLNTCGFIEAARQDSYDAIEQMCEDKGERLLIVTGCLTQERGDEIRADYPEVDLVSGVGNFDKVIEALELGEDRVPTTRPDDAVYDGLRDRPLLTPAHLAFVKISEGCNYRCSFCRIPIIRGDQRSRRVEQITDEVRSLVARGVGEVMLVSQNTSDFGRDTGEDLLALVRSLAEVEGLRWVRLHYLYPGIISTEKLSAILATPKVLPYLDMPVQHASPEVLRAMNRPVRTDKLVAQFAALRAAQPELVLRTTILLGFPGEEEEHVEEALDFLAAVRFDHVGTYRYSPEAGTRGAEMPLTVDPEEMADREALMTDLQVEIAGERQAGRLGTVHESVVDRIDSVGEWRELLDELCADLDDTPAWTTDDDAPVAVARTMHYAYETDGVVLMDGADEEPGIWGPVEISAVTPFDALARRLPTTEEGGS